MTINGVECTFHHLGIPTTEARPGERYSELFKLHTSDSQCGLMRVQFHRYEPGSPMHPLIQTLPHAAFKVPDLKRAIEGRTLLLGPYEPIPGVQVAIIEDGGHPIELIQTTLTEEEVWAPRQRDTLLYGPAETTPKTSPT